MTQESYVIYGGDNEIPFYEVICYNSHPREVLSSADFSTNYAIFSSNRKHDYVLL